MSLKTEITFRSLLCRSLACHALIRLASGVATPRPELRINS
jgi:hypothetical protein